MMGNRQQREKYCRSFLEAVEIENISFQQRVDIIKKTFEDEDLVPAEIEVLTMLLDAKIKEDE